MVGNRVGNLGHTLQGLRGGICVAVNFNGRVLEVEGHLLRVNL